MIRSVVAALLAIVAAGPPANAAVREEFVVYDAGKARAPFVLRDGSARGFGMAGAFCALPADASAATWNPGALSELSDASVVAMHETGGDAVSFGSAAASVPLGGFGTAAVSGGLAAYGRLVERSATGAAGAGRQLLDSSVTLAWGGLLPRGLGVGGGVGAGVELLRAESGGTRVAATAGLLALAGGFGRVGVSLLHLGSCGDGFGLPTEVRTGAALTPSADLTVAFDVGYPFAAREPWLALGAEYRAAAAFRLRAGYRWQPSDDGLPRTAGLAGGAGFADGPFGLDYAFQPYGDLGASHRISVAYAFSGGTGLPPLPAVTLSRGGGRLADPAAAFASANAAFAAGRYAEAAAEAEAIVAADPGNWEARQFLGACKWRLGDRPEALDQFHRSLLLNPANTALRGFVDAAEGR